MSPVRNASKALADVMRRSELRGAAAERQRLAMLAQARHEAGGYSGAHDDPDQDSGQDGAGQDGARHPGARHPGARHPDTRHDTADFRTCAEPGCAALTEILGPPDH